MADRFLTDEENLLVRRVVTKVLLPVHGGNQTSLASHLGIDQSTLSGFIHGRQGTSRSVAAKAHYLLVQQGSAEATDLSIMEWPEDVYEESTRLSKGRKGEWVIAPQSAAVQAELDKAAKIARNKAAHPQPAAEPTTRVARSSRGAEPVSIVYPSREAFLAIAKEEGMGYADQIAVQAMVPPEPEQDPGFEFWQAAYINLRRARLVLRKQMREVDLEESRLGEELAAAEEKRSKKT